MSNFSGFSGQFCEVDLMTTTTMKPTTTTQTSSTTSLPTTTSTTPPTTSTSTTKLATTTATSTSTSTPAVTPKLCVPVNNCTVHYRCDASGNLNCVDGWAGINCDQMVPGGAADCAVFNCKFYND